LLRSLIPLIAGRGSEVWNPVPGSSPSLGRSIFPQLCSAVLCCALLRVACIVEQGRAESAVSQPQPQLSAVRELQWIRTIRYTPGTRNHSKLHRTTLHCITLHYTTLHCTARRCTIVVAQKFVFDRHSCVLHEKLCDSCCYLYSLLIISIVLHDAATTCASMQTDSVSVYSLENLARPRSSSLRV
jgi:hypothetical protein